jgi:cysteine desulfurase
MSRQAALRDTLESAVLEGASRTRIAARAADRLPNLSALLVDGASAEALVAALDGAGVEISSGSACSSGAAQASHVLAAMGEESSRTALLRLSIGRGTSADDVTMAAQRIVAAIGVAAHAGPPQTVAASARP